MSDEELSTVEYVEAGTVGDEVTGDAVAEDAEGGDGDGTADKSKRGRPRDPQAAERDERVKTALASGPQTREQLAATLELEGNLVYLSLWRLRNAGVVQKVDTEGVKRGWQLVAAE